MPSFQVARPQSTPEKSVPASEAMRSDSVNCALLTPALKIDERLGGDGGGCAEMIQRFRVRVGLLALVNAAAFDELGVDRYFDFQDVDVVLRLGELLHALA